MRRWSKREVVEVVVALAGFVLLVVVSTYLANQLGDPNGGEGVANGLLLAGLAVAGAVSWLRRRGRR